MVTHHYVRFFLSCKRIEYISRDTPRFAKEKREKERERVQRRDNPYPPFVLLHALPREEQGRHTGRSVKEGREHRTRRDPQESTRPPPWSPRIVEFAFGEEVLLLCLTSPHLTSPHFSACCCFAFYTGVEIWSLDSPMHYPAFSSRTRSIVLLQKRIYII